MSSLSVFLIFLRLGLTSFGGPVAHLGYFRDEFVVRRKWLDEARYADLVALCQFVPGPASSQAGFALGLMQGGLKGGMAAWAGFTLPSASLMVLAAYGLAFANNPAVQGIIHGLKLVAVAVVAQAVWGMAKSLCPDRERASIAFVAAAILLAFPSTALQLAVIAGAGLAGWALVKPGQGNAEAPLTTVPASRRAAAIAAFVLFLLLLAGLPVLAILAGSREIAVADAFYRAGALVFGGGHVVLPLLQESVVAPGWTGPEAFLAGYGAAQAVPGPLFTFAAYLGAIIPAQWSPVTGAAVATAAIFLPGLLLIYAALPAWDTLRNRTGIRSVLAGVNAGVVGLLAAALYNPIFVSAVDTPIDLAVVLVALAALTLWQVPVLAVVAGTALAALGLQAAGG